jgi:glycosyltransferase involved in cell wall biosynthesis
MPSEQPVILHARVVTGTGGGPEKTILTSPRYLIPFGYRVLCAYLHPPGDPGFETLRVRAQELGAPLVEINDRGPWDVSVIWNALDVCRKRRVTIWHGHDYKSNLLGLLLRPFWPMSLVSTVHGWGSLVRLMPWYSKIDRRCLRKYQRVICVSEDLVTQCVASGVSADRCVLIENGIETDRYQRQRSVEEAKRQLGFNPERLLIGAVGRLAAEKDFPSLIRAVDRLFRDGRNVELMLVGEGDERGPLETLVDQLKLTDRVHFLGHRTDLIGLYEAMDAFVLSSRREGLPNVVLEAMAMEVPVIATRIAGLPKLIEHETSGLLVEPEDTEGLTAALGQLLADPDRRRTLAAAGRRTIEQRYSFAVRMAKVRAVYDSLLGR